MRVNDLDDSQLHWFIVHRQQLQMRISLCRMSNETHCSKLAPSLMTTKNPKEKQPKTSYKVKVNANS